jgi:Fe-coproporphyrin III synthase
VNLQIPDVRTLEINPCQLPSQRLPTSSCLEERNELGIPLLLRAVRDAAELGYNFLHVAGEEPLSYPSLPALCREAHRHGMLTSMVTRTATVTAPQLEWLRFSIDLLGVEVKRRSVASRRRSTKGVQTLENRLECVRNSKIPFAIVFPLTVESLTDLEWAAEFAVAQGADILQVRPARELSDDQMATAWMMVECMSELHRGKLVIHFDAVNRYCLPTEPDDLASWKRDLEREPRYLGEVLSPLVVEADGTVSPLRSGFPRRFSLGNLHEERLSVVAARWIETQSSAFCEVYGRVLREARTADRMFGDLYELLSTAVGNTERGLSAAASR